MLQLLIGLSIHESVWWSGCYGFLEEALAKNSNFSQHMLVQYMTIQICLTWSDRECWVCKKAAAGLPQGRGYCKVRWIMNWRQVFLETEMLPVFAQAKHRKRASLLRDEDVPIQIHEWLLQTSKVYKTPDKLCQWINESLHVEIMGCADSNISECTVNRCWMISWATTMACGRKES